MKWWSKVNRDFYKIQEIQRYGFSLLNINTRNWLCLKKFEKHFLYQEFFTQSNLLKEPLETKLHKRKTVGRQPPEWHDTADVEGNQTRMVSREIGTLRIVITKIPAGTVSSFYQRAECLDEPRFISVHICLDMYWRGPDAFTFVPAPASSWVRLLHP